MDILNILRVGADLRNLLLVLPNLNMNSGHGGHLLEMKTGRELILNFCLRNLKDAVVVLLAAMNLCEEWEINFDWKDIICWELNLVVKSIYKEARAVRKTVIEKARFSVLAPTATGNDVSVGINHISVLLNFGEDLGSFVEQTLGGKPFPQGKKLRMPIFGTEI